MKKNTNIDKKNSKQVILTIEELIELGKKNNKVELANVIVIKDFQSNEDEENSSDDSCSK